MYNNEGSLGMIDKKEATESIDSYLGEKEKEVLKTLDKNTLKLFISKKIKPYTSYYVRGTEKLLRQFKAYYLVCCNKEEERLKYGLQMLTERVKLLSGYDLTDNIGVDEILFIYAHKNDMDLGNSETWLAKTIINDVANRNRKGYVTIILSERDLDLVKASGELVPINLSVKGTKETEEEANKIVVKNNGTVY